MSNTHAEERDPSFEALLDYLGRTRGFDFTAYKQGSLMRRISKRLQTIGVESFADYTDYLEVHPEEFGQLFNSILINVTSFFRDPPAWEHLAQEILPRILASKPEGAQVRVWSAGCASGEEVYSLAMLLAEAIGLEQLIHRAKVYATDVDEESLSTARLASYPPERVKDVPPPLLEKYFEKSNGRYVIQKDLRRLVIFGRHDLIQDAPISRVDLLVCRNTLMYFNAETQARIFNRFDFALNSGGYLFLGKAEVMLSRISTLTPADLKRRIFYKTTGGRAPAQPYAIPARLNADDYDRSSVEARLRAAALEIDPNAQLIVDASGTLVTANEAARNLLGVSGADISRPLNELDLSRWPANCRTLIDQARAERQPRTLRDVEWTLPLIERRVFDVAAIPLRDGDSDMLGTKLVFSDVTRVRRLQDELSQSHQELETTNEELQSSNEELETTNEELQSTIEELETTNEELQSTNEELETMNEEMQSTNEELQSTNDVLRLRGDELDNANAFMSSILSSLRDGVIVLNRDLHVLAWNTRSEEMWGLRAEEVREKHFMNLDIGLPVEQLKQPIRICLSGEGEANAVVLNATNRRGKGVQVQVTCTRLVGQNGAIQGSILFTEELKC